MEALNLLTFDTAYLITFMLNTTLMHRNKWKKKSCTILALTEVSSRVNQRLLKFLVAYSLCKAPQKHIYFNNLTFKLEGGGD